MNSTPYMMIKMMKNQNFALKLEQLVKQYKNGVTAVKGIDLTVQQGDFFALLGPNGAGKSTTIGMISNLVNKTSGRIKIMGLDLDQDRAGAKALLGIVPQEINLNGFEPPLQILVQQAGYYGVPRVIALERAHYYLQALGLAQKAHQPAMRLSGGMKRRLMIARALVHEPKVLLLDEPTAGVDVEIRQEMWRFLSELRAKTGLTIILTTHYLEEAENLCNRIAIINQGEIIADTTMKALLTQLESETLVLYLKDAVEAPPPLKTGTVRQIDAKTLEVDLKQADDLSNVFAELAAAGVSVHSMRNKANRLEQLFVNLVQTHQQKEGTQP